ncbi:MAG TPA: GNAT family N-acetyltransferase [Puia sp.]|nr:GNAT family N-acetyltransferase [Puia sp.]
MLLQDATSRQLEQAAAVNHTALFRQEAAVLGGNVISREGLEWTSGSPQVPSMIAFPTLLPEQTGERLDELMHFYLRYPPKGAGCWSLDPPQPVDLGLRLLARGFQVGWRPRWMALDLGRVQTPNASPWGLSIVRDNHSSLDKVKGLPYAQVIIPSEHTAEMPGQWTRFIARWQGKIVAHSVVFLSSGPYGAAGIYHVGVVPRARRLGIGKAVTLAACMYARDKGYRYAVLNSTDAGRRTYEALGFETIGEGWTWWLVTDRLLAHPPTPQEVKLAEAIGMGRLEELQELRSQFDAAALNRPMTNHMSWMQLAVYGHQPTAGQWLLDAGATCTVLDAWDLGWKERARQLLHDDPAAVNELYGEWDKTLLHVAAERGDEELTRLALGATPDLRLKDKAYQSTSLEWARHFGHNGIVHLIEAYRR